MSVATEPATTPAPAAPASRPRRRGRTIAIVVAALIVLGALVGAGVVLLVDQGTKDARKVADRFVRAVDRGDGVAAYALTDPAFRAATSEDRLDGLVDQLAPLAAGGQEVAGRSIDVSTGSGKLAVVVYRLRAADGGSIYFKTQLRERDDRWRVMNFRSSRSALPADVE